MIESLSTEDFKVGDVYDLETENRHYTLELTKRGFFISGHPSYCAIATRCIIIGATPGGWAFTVPGVIKVGEHFTFETQTDGTTATTSKVKAITRQ